MIETIESDFVHDGNADNFSSIVIENSNLGPVLINFWSRKAGPCLRQYPILDKIVHEYNGRLLLVNIDTEKEIIISKKYGIASVPTLKLMRFGEIKFSLHGYQSEVDLKKVIDKYVLRESDKIIEQAILEYSHGNHDKAYNLLADAIVDDQINPRLPLTICKLLKHEKRYDDVFKLLEALPAALKNDDEILFLSNRLFFISIFESIDDIKILKANNTNSLSDVKKLSAHFVVKQEYELALGELEKIISMNFEFDNAYARVAMLKIFNIIGDNNLLTKKYRPLLLKYTH